jgi:hypothetical protein
MKPDEFIYLNEGIPLHMWAPLEGYIERHEPVGHFLTALLSNNLKEAFARADAFNVRLMHVYVAYLQQHAPARCWGSPEKVEAWLRPTGKCACTHPVAVHSGRGCAECPCVEPFYDGWREKESDLGPTPPDMED